MNACLRGIERGFFKGVCTLSNATAHPFDPTPPRNTKELEPCQWDPGPKRITPQATVSGDLA
jgi:hypothetical protein